MARPRQCGGAEENRAPRPFLKWVGGKRGLLPELEPLLPPGVESMRMVELFAGGAAMFFAACNPQAVLCDINRALIDTYRAVQADVENVISHLAHLSRRHSESHYYLTRDRFNTRRFACDAEAAAAFIYLNKTCFNGLYRVNRKGEFNVPLGRYERPKILDAEGLRSASDRLQAAELHVRSFDVALEYIRPGDFVYLDSPYVPRSLTSNFTSYHSAGFARHDHERVRDVFAELARSGINVMASNSDTPTVRALYRGWGITRVRARRSVGCSAASRAVVNEVVIRSYA
jgi:DNA adenine methylase